MTKIQVGLCTRAWNQIFRMPVASLADLAIAQLLRDSTGARLSNPACLEGILPIPMKMIAHGNLRNSVCNALRVHRGQTRQYANVGYEWVEEVASRLIPIHSELETVPYIQAWVIFCEFDKVSAVHSFLTRYIIFVRLLGIIRCMATPDDLRTPPDL